MLSKILTYLNGTRMFFNLWLLLSSLPLLKSKILSTEHFTEILLITTGVYFLGATGSYLVYNVQGQNPAHERSAKHKYTSGEFLYFCFIFGLAYSLLMMNLIDTETYFTIVIWVYCLYNGVNVGNQFLKARAGRIASVMDLDSMPETHERKEANKRRPRRRRRGYGDDGEYGDAYNDESDESDESEHSEADDESDESERTRKNESNDPSAHARSYHD